MMIMERWREEPDVVMVKDKSKTAKDRKACWWVAIDVNRKRTRVHRATKSQLTNTNVEEYRTIIPFAAEEWVDLDEWKQLWRKPNGPDQRGVCISDHIHYENVGRQREIEDLEEEAQDLGGWTDESEDEGWRGDGEENQVSLVHLPFCEQE